MIKLSILIPSTDDRDELLYELLDHLHYQLDEFGVKNEVEIITDIDNGELSVGRKRQRLIEKAKGEYLCFIDSDDWVSNDYIEEIFLAMKENPDVIGFFGYMTHSGMNRENFRISKDLPYITVLDAFGNKEYLRHSNHLSIIKRVIALQIGYNDLQFAEDYDYSLRLKNSNLIKTEKIIESYLYHYRYNKNK
jgi:glycosyltransferase involved in cell wall biosynthesis